MSAGATAWITGARGFIGRHLARRLADAGQAVAGIGHGAWPAAEAAQWGVARWINGDVSGSNLHALSRGCGLPDTVFHLAGGASVGAAIANPDEDFHRTVESTMALLEWLRLVSPRTRIVMASSAAVYGAGHVGPIAEEVQGQPYSPYGYHKHMMEQLCRSYGSSFGLQSVVLRLFSVYGPGLRKQLLWDLCTKLGAGGVPRLGGSGDELRDWVEVSDAAAVLAAAPSMATAEAPILNVGTGLATSVKHVASLVLESWRPPRDSGHLRFDGIARPGDPFSLQADIRRLTEQGLRCTVLPDQGIPGYVRWFQSLGSVPP